jgi:hypothetical protein
VVFEPGRVIGDVVGRFVLEPTGDGGTRLLFRESVVSQGPGAAGPAALVAGVWDPLHFVMVRRVLEGIQERAEGRPLVPAGVLLAARAGWLLAGAGVAWLFLSRRGRWAWLAVPVLAVVPGLLASGDWDAALAGFLAVGITVGGALVFGRRWWPTYLLVAAAVLLVLLLAPDGYAAFGLLFLAGACLAAAVPARRLWLPWPRAGGRPARAWR